MSEKKKKKEKVVYYDDGSTIADMSRVNRTGEKRPERPVQKSGFREKWKTYWAAVRMMIVPMFVVLFILLLLFVITSLIGNCAQ